MAHHITRNGIVITVREVMRIVHAKHGKAYKEPVQIATAGGKVGYAKNSQKKAIRRLLKQLKAA